jgi:hypothetical protein
MESKKICLSNHELRYLLTATHYVSLGQEAIPLLSIIPLSYQMGSYSGCPCPFLNWASSMISAS